MLNPVSLYSKDFTDDNKRSNIGLDYLKKATFSDYIIGKGDSLLVVISRDYPELNSSVLISGEGTINLPSIGTVYVEGLTVSELTKLLTKAYIKFVKFPNIEIKIINYRPIKVMVNGEVNSPGLITLEGSMRIGEQLFLDQNKLENSKNLNELINSNISFYFPTVFDAIRSSEGITTYSDLSNVQIIRRNSLSNGGGKIKTFLDFDKMEDIENKNIRIYDGDSIFIRRQDTPNNGLIVDAIRLGINPKYIKVFVTGKVNNPGEKVISKASTLNDAIDIAGGLEVFNGKIKYVSYQNNGTTESKSIKYKRYAKRVSKKNPYLRNGDITFVGDNFFSVTTTVINEITKPFTGLYSGYRLIQLLNE